MHIKLLIFAAAIALVAGVGSASAGENFATIEGVSASALSPAEMDAVRGQRTLRVRPGDGPGGPAPTQVLLLFGKIPEAAFPGLMVAEAQQPVADVF